MIDIERLNPVPRDLSTGWSRSSEGAAARARVEWGTGPDPRRRPGRLRAAAVAAAVVLALVASVVVLRGTESTTTPASTVERLAHGKWTSLPAPLVGQDVVATVWTGHELIVWGSSGGAELVHGEWRTLPRSPLGIRTGAIVRWTGAEMIVLGGQTPPFLATPAVREPPVSGAAYNPYTRSWRTIAVAPFIPEGGTATWTGHVLVAMNGVSSAAASYDPASDQWHVLPGPPFSLPGNPTVRAAWDGHEVVFTLWPGTSGAVAISYDPSTDSWRRLGNPRAGGAYAFHDLFRSGNDIVQVGWYATGDRYGELYAEVLRHRWERVGQLRPHGAVCQPRATGVPGGGVVLCGGHEVLAFDTTGARWVALPRAPAVIASTTWTGDSLVATTTGGRIVRLSLGARSI